MLALDDGLYYAQCFCALMSLVCCSCSSASMCLLARICCDMCATIVPTVRVFSNAVYSLFVAGLPETAKV